MPKTKQKDKEKEIKQNDQVEAIQNGAKLHETLANLFFNISKKS